MHMFRTVLTRETRCCHYKLDLPLSLKVIVKLFQWNINISSLMTSVAKNIQTIGKKNMVQECCWWLGSVIACFSNSVYHNFGYFFLPKNALFFKIFHICLPTVTSILTWPENDIGRTCIYSNDLSKTVKKLLLRSVIFRYSMGSTGLIFKKKSSRIFWLWLELSRAFLQNLPIHTQTFHLSYWSWTYVQTP